MLSRKRGRKYKLFRTSLFEKKHDSNVQYNVHNVIYNTVSYGIKRYNCMIAISEPALLTHNQIEASRKIVARRIRKFKPKASYYSPLKFTLPLTVKSKNSRMGKGKGKFSMFIASVKAMEPIFILRNVTSGCAVGLANKLRHKLPVALCVYKYTNRQDAAVLFDNRSNIQNPALLRNVRRSFHLRIRKQSSLYSYSGCSPLRVRCCLESSSIKEKDAANRRSSNINNAQWFLCFIVLVVSCLFI
jgi:ribosomal protein L16/L10AE